MDIYSFDEKNLNRDTEQNNLYDLFKTTTAYIEFQELYSYTVPPEEDMRFDRVCKSIYGSTSYVEELMMINGYTDTFSVKANDVIMYPYVDDLDAMHVRSDDRVERDKLVNELKKTQTDPMRKNNEILPPTIKPEGLQQLTVDEKAKKITIINKFF